jgi:hypothetical protein
VVSQSTRVAISDFALALSFSPLDSWGEVALITRHTQSHAVLNHLGVPSLAMAGNPKNLAGEGIVVDVLVLEVRVRGVRMLRVEDLAEAFRVVRDPDEGALGYPSARLILKTGSRRQLA